MNVDLWRYAHLDQSCGPVKVDRWTSVAIETLRYPRRSLGGCLLEVKLQGLDFNLYACHAA